MNTNAHQGSKYFRRTVLLTVYLLFILTTTSHQPFASAQGASKADMFLRQEAINQLMAQVEASLKKYEGVDRVAVMKFTGDPDGMVQKHFISTLVGTRLYQVIEREHLDKILAEADWQTADIMDPATAVEAGKIAGVQAVVYGEVTETSTDGKLQLATHLRMIKVQDGTILWSGNPTGAADRSLWERESVKTTKKKLGGVFASYAKPVGIGLAVLIVLILIVRAIARGERKFDTTPLDKGAGGVAGSGGSGGGSGGAAGHDSLKGLQRARKILQDAMNAASDKKLSDAESRLGDLDKNLGLAELHIQNNQDRFGESEQAKVETRIQDIQRLADRIQSNIEDADGSKVTDLAKSANDAVEDIKEL